MKIKNIALIGAGAVGSYFIWGLTDRADLNFYVIAENDRKDRLTKEGLCINNHTFFPAIYAPSEAPSADLILIATKYGAVKDAAVAAAQILKPDTIVLSLLNGVDSEESVAEVIPEDHILPSMMQIASHRVGNTVRFVPERTPGVFFGERNGAMDTERLQALDALFSSTELHYHIVPNILQEIWLKMAFNVSMNLPQAILGCTIDGYVKSEHMKSIRVALRAEVCAIAAAMGIDITELSTIEKMEYPSVANAKYSTLQDLEAGRHTEIDMFSGTLMRLGEKYGIPTPYNAFAYHAIHALEQKNDHLFE